MSNFEEWKRDFKDYIKSLDLRRDDYIGIMEFIDEVPSVELKKGKWVRASGYATPGGDPVWRCSECGKGLHVWGVEHRTYGGDVSDSQWVSCPNCGAKMEGEYRWMA